MYRSRLLAREFGSSACWESCGSAGVDRLLVNCVLDTAIRVCNKIKRELVCVSISGDSLGELDRCSYSSSVLQLKEDDVWIVRVASVFSRLLGNRVLECGRIAGGCDHWS